MRLIRTVGVGGSITAAAWILTITTTGLLGATAFVLLPFAAAVTIGILVAAVLDSDRPRRSVAGNHCSSCRQTLAEVGDGLWICGVCDAAPRIAA